MKRFAFSLERVLAWRRIEARIERVRWEQIRAERKAIEDARENLRFEAARSAEGVRAARSATGAELEALDRFRVFVEAEQQRLGHQSAECEKRGAAQAAIARAKERDVKVLEHLRERQLDTWSKAEARETEQAAAESYLARWRPPNLSR